MYFPAPIDKWVNNEHGFEEFWKKNGGLKIFGYPITGATLIEGNLVIQFFERARFERKVDSKGKVLGEVMLGRVGAEFIELRDMHQKWFRRFQQDHTSFV